MWGQRHGRRRSEAILRSLRDLEAPEVMDHGSTFPVVLRKAEGARVQDADGNWYLDLTSFFGVATVGHRNRAVIQAVRRECGRMLHAMGDVHPADVKAAFLRELRGWLPAPDYRAVLSLNGSDAVETALKFAAAATARRRVVAFEGSYHGLSLGALEVTAQAAFRRPFSHLLSDRAVILRFPREGGPEVQTVLETIARLARDRVDPVGAVIVEPIQGRGGFRTPPAGFLKSLEALAREERIVLIADEIYTGVGRTGTFLACDPEGVVPDILCLGKALGAGVPLSVCLMRPHVAGAVRPAGAEAVHTSTFLGHPLGCAAGVAVLRELKRRRLCEAARRIGAVLMRRAESWLSRFPLVRSVRGRGAMVGVEIAGPDQARSGATADAIVRLALERGVILLAEGEHGDVLAFTPPLVISDHDLRHALQIVETCIADICSRETAGG